MTINSRVELEEFIKGCCTCPVTSVLADSAHNLGHDSTYFYSDAAIEGLYENRLPNPVTRRDISDLNSCTMAKVSDFLGMAAIRLFINMGLIVPSRPPSPRISQGFSELMPLIQGVAARSSSYLPRLPAYYEHVAANGINPEYGCQALFLEPAVPQMLNQQRLLICPFLASDGATYNLVTLAFLLRNNISSPITGQPLQPTMSIFNKVIAHILKECWYAQGDCVGLFTHNLNMQALSARRACSAFIYTNELIAESLSFLISKQVDAPNCCCKSCEHWTGREVIYCSITTGVCTTMVGLPILMGAVVAPFISWSLCAPISFLATVPGLILGMYMNRYIGDSYYLDARNGIGDHIFNFCKLSRFKQDDSSIAILQVIHNSLIKDEIISVQPQ